MVKFEKLYNYLQKHSDFEMCDVVYKVEEILFELDECSNFATNPTESIIGVAKKAAIKEFKKQLKLNGYDSKYVMKLVREGLME